MPKELKLSYLAGIIDGEGCINISKTTNFQRWEYNLYILKLTITNVDLSLVQWISLNFPEFKCYENKNKNLLSKRKAYRMLAQNEKAIEILNSVLKYLVIKKDRARYVLEEYPKHNEINPEKREEVYNRLKLFNQRTETNSNPIGEKVEV
jgi:hypothetical protein